MGGEPAGAIAVQQLKLARYFVDPRLGQGPKFLQYMTFPTLQASDKWLAANPQVAERVVREGWSRVPECTGIWSRRSA